MGTGRGRTKRLDCRRGTPSPPEGRASVVIWTTARQNILGTNMVALVRQKVVQRPAPKVSGKPTRDSVLLATSTHDALSGDCAKASWPAFLARPFCLDL